MNTSDRSPAAARKALGNQAGQSLLEVILVILVVMVPVSLLLVTFIIGNWNQTYAFSSARNEALERMIEPRVGWEDDEKPPCVTTKRASWILFKPKNLAEFTTEVRLYQPSELNGTATPVCDD